MAAFKQGFLLILISYILNGTLWAQNGAAAAKPSSWTTSKIKTVLDKIDELWRGKSSEGQLTMRVKTAHYERTMTMKMWSYGEDYFLIRILEPAKERGTATLKRDDQIYNYLPKVNRTLKIGTAMMGGSWMGSHFTNDDLVQSSRLAEDFTYTAIQDAPDKLTIELTPKKESAVVWGKVSIEVSYPSLLPIEQVYYDEDLKKVRTLTFSDIREMGGRTMPARLKVIPTDHPEEFTEMIYQDMKFDTGLDQSFFSLTKLKSMQ